MALAIEIIIYFIIVLVSYAIDDKSCKEGNGILFLHHAGNVFANFGWLSNDEFILKIYLLVPVIMIIHWMINGNKCISTQIYNERCDTPERPFNDVFDQIGLKRQDWWNNYGHAIYLIFGHITALYKLGYLPKINFSRTIFSDSTKS